MFNGRGAACGGWLLSFVYFLTCVSLVHFCICFCVFTNYILTAGVTEIGGCTYCFWGIEF
jgi:hypothetical protein